MPIVTMYATHACPHCQRALDLIDTDQIGANRIRVFFIDDDLEARSRFRRHGFTGVPAFETDTDQWQGFDPVRLRLTVNQP